MRVIKEEGREKRPEEQKNLWVFLRTKKDKGEQYEKTGCL